MKINKIQSLILLFLLLLGLAVILIPMLFEENIFSQRVDSILAKFPHLPKAPKFQHYQQNLLHKNSTAIDSVLPMVTAWVNEIDLNNTQTDLKSMVDMLQTKGYTAFLQTDASNHTHIFIGPELDKNTAAQKCKELTGLLPYKVRVIQYTEMKI